MYVYINKNLNGVHELETQLVFFETGETCEDYLAGKWILLSEQQNDFRLANPAASAKEIIAVELDPAVEPPEPPEPIEPVTPQEIYDGIFTVQGMFEFLEGLMVSVAVPSDKQEQEEEVGHD